jgi:subtilisin family serine protease/subtilisin-like proprotein convertase family protein
MASRTPPRRSPLGLEQLEDRTLPSTGTLSGAAAAATGSAPYSSTDVLVEFRTGTGQQAPAALPGTQLGQTFAIVPGLYEVTLDPGTTVATALAEYKADAQVVDAEPDYLLGKSTLPNDPQFSQQYYLNNTGQNGGTPGADIHAPAAWNVTTGTPSVVVATIDTGIDYNHPDLYQNVWINQAEIPASRMANLVDVDGDGVITFADLNDPRNQGPFKITDVNGDGRITAADILAPMVLDSQGHDTGQGGWAYPKNTQDGDTAHPNDFVGWNFVTNTNDPYDDNDHGTNVAGIIGAKGNNGVGVAGIDWNASLMALKFLDANGGGSGSGAIGALNYAVLHGAKITNNSWTGSGNSTALEQAIAAARSRGVIFVAAAGNNGSNNDTNPEYPASFPLDNIVSVASTDQFDNLSPFSNFGPHSVSLAAPGQAIYSTSGYGGYASLSGTSESAPQVAGVLALVWGQHPGWTYQQVIAQVLNTTDPLPSLKGKVVSGGRLDAAAAVGAVVNPAPGPKVVSAFDSGPVYNTLGDVHVTFDSAVNPATFTPAAVTFTGPSGQTIAATAVKAVPGTGDTQFDVGFPTQTAAGVYTLSLGTGPTDFSGDPVQAYQATFTLQPSTTVASTQGMSILPTSRWVVSPLTVGPALTIGKVTVQLNITYPYDSDLYIHLQAPDGTDILLSNQRGGNYPNFVNTVFDDQGPTPIYFGKAPLAGSYRPEVALSYLNGRGTAGTWNLWVENRGGRGSGTLNGWSLTFTPPVDNSAHPTSLSSDTGTITASTTTTDGGGSGPSPGAASLGSDSATSGGSGGTPGQTGGTSLSGNGDDPAGQLYAAAFTFDDLAAWEQQVSAMLVQLLGGKGGNAGN